MPELITVPELAARLDELVRLRRARRDRPGGAERPPEEARLLTGNIPTWWADPEVRGLVVSLHGRQTVDKALEQIRGQVGDRAPSRSSMHRVWQRLSRAAGAPSRRIRTA